MIKIAPSILAADFSCLGREIKEVEEAGVDLLHVDVMDGHFVPNLTVGVPVVASLKRKTELPLDVHLMIDNPLSFIEPFAMAGADIIGFHTEVTEKPLKVIEAIKSYGKKACLAFNPVTPLSGLESLLTELDMVLLMTVNPGFGGQKFMPEVLPKIRHLRKMVDEKGILLDIQVDGGIDEKTGKEAIKAGANVLVVGTAIFSQPDRGSIIKLLRGGKACSM